MVSIREFQGKMRRLYYHRDIKRGVEATFKWLREEMDELGDAMQRGTTNDIAEEFADVIAWVFSLANILEIDLEGAALGKYDDGCPKCGASPCHCPFDAKQV